MFFRNLSRIFYWTFGVITCAYYAIETEWICSQTSFLWALFAPLLVIPVSNAASLLSLSLKPKSSQTLSILATFNGIAFVVSAILAIVLLPLCLIAAIGSVIMPFAALGQLLHHEAKLEGLWMVLVCPFYLCVALGPVITSSWLRADINKLAPQDKPIKKFPLKSCLAIVVCLIVLAVFQTALTRASSSAVASGTQLKEGLLLLRAVGDQNELLRECYSESSSLPWFFNWGNLRDDETSAGNIISREIFYRVKGRPFNSVPRPAAPKQSRPFLDGPFSPMMTDDSSAEDGDGEASRFYDYNFDNDFAGDAVGGIVRGLSLSSSSIEGWVDPNEAVSHMTWKMRFHGAGKGKELRAQILLPPRAVVTNCSLVVNGTRREAVVGPRQSARTAYVSAAQQGQRPLLISTAGAGRVLLQSSTGWWHSDANLSVEITAPLVVLAKDKAALPFPMLTERNFDVPVSHQISIKCPTQSSVSNSLIGKGLVANRTGIDGSVSNWDLSNGLAAALFARDPGANQVITAESTDKKLDILQQIRSHWLSSKTPLVVVVDGSSTMSDWTGTVCDALKKIHFSDVSILWASDIPEEVISHTDTTSIQWVQALDKLRDSSCLGGQNNAEALSMAITKLAGSRGANIVWLHGPQPVSFSGSSLLGLLQNLPKVNLYEYQLVNGPNEVIKSLDQSNALVQVPHIERAQADLDSLFGRLSGAIESFDIDRHYVAHNSSKALQAAHANEIAQLNMGNLVLAHLPFAADHENFATLAETYNLVTPLTSAVVLEHDADYAANGLTKNSKSPSSSKMATKSSSALQAMAGGLIPSKPEPPMPLLVFFTLLILGPVLCIKRRKYILS